MTNMCGSVVNSCSFLVTPSKSPSPRMAWSPVLSAISSRCRSSVAAGSSTPSERLATPACGTKPKQRQENNNHRFFPGKAGELGVSA